MEMNDAIKIIKPEPDSHYRLVRCQCKSDNVAYVKYCQGGSELWHVQCFDCGRKACAGDAVRHDAQVLWNGLQYTAEV